MHDVRKVQGVLNACINFRGATPEFPLWRAAALRAAHCVQPRLAAAETRELYQRSIQQRARDSPASRLSSAAVVCSPALTARNCSFLPPGSPAASPLLPFAPARLREYPQPRAAAGPDDPQGRRGKRKWAVLQLTGKCQLPNWGPGFLSQDPDLLVTATAVAKECGSQTL